MGVAGHPFSIAAPGGHGGGTRPAIPRPGSSGIPPANAAGIPRVHNAAVLASAPLTLTKVCMTIPLLDGLTNPVDPGLSRLERSPSLRQWSLGRRRPMATPMDMSLTAGHSPRRPMRPLSAQLQPHDRDLSLRVLAQ